MVYIQDKRGIYDIFALMCKYSKIDCIKYLLENYKDKLPENRIASYWILANRNYELMELLKEYEFDFSY